MWKIVWMNKEKTVGEIWRMKPYQGLPPPPAKEGTIRRSVAQRPEHLALNQECVGSTPTGPM